jgi:UDP-N-acetylmuramate dehydrogenase
MSASWIAELQRSCPGRVRVDEPLAPYTTYRIGGPADVLLEPENVEDVQAALAAARRHGVPWLALGLGSNVLVADAGFRGLVLRVGRALSTVREHADGWEVGAGLPTPLLARRSARRGLAGVHRLVGVPGSVGGGVYMNAGAHGQEFRHVVRSVTLVREDGTIEERPAGAIGWRYRSSGLRAVVVIAADLALRRDDPRRLSAEIAEHFRWRKAGTPFSEACCGSVFRNPADTIVLSPDADGEPRELRTAGQLIDAAGLKGLRIGGAEVSRLHANYIVNVGGATASDVWRVMDAVRDRVAHRFGITMELEVQVIGVAGG